MTAPADWRRRLRLRASPPDASCRAGSRGALTQHHRNAPGACRGSGARRLAFSPRRAVPALLLVPALLVGLAGAAFAQTIVPGDWPLKPAGLGPSDKFRLLFVTSTTRDATSTNIADYNAFVQRAAAAGHSAIRRYSSQFRALGSAGTVAARDNTMTTGTGVPIYWLGGTKVADHYADFYDGSWDDVAGGKTETGANPANTQFLDVWTGSNRNGTRPSTPAARLGGATPATGRIGSIVAERPHHFNPISSGGGARTERHPFYGLSPVFQVRPAVTFDRTHYRVTEGGRVTLTANLSGPLNEAVTFDITGSGTATWSSDLDRSLDAVVPALAFVIYPGRTSISFNVITFDDSENEGSEHLEIALVPRPSAAGKVDVGAPATVIITDNDARLSLDAFPASVEEGNSGYRDIEVTVTNPRAYTPRPDGSGADNNLNPRVLPRYRLCFGGTATPDKTHSSRVRRGNASADYKVLTPFGTVANWSGGCARVGSRTNAIIRDDSSRTWTVRVFGDAVAEADETVDIRLDVSTDQHGSSFSNGVATATLTLVDGGVPPPPTPAVSVEATYSDGKRPFWASDPDYWDDPTWNEGGGWAGYDSHNQFVAFRIRSTVAVPDDAPIELNYTLQGGATLGEDYKLTIDGTEYASASALPATISFSGDSELVLVEIIDDDHEDGGEIVRLILDPGTGYTLHRRFVTNRAAWTIANSDPDAPPAPPLTAEFAAAPGEHAGKAFSVRIAFSAALAQSAGRALRNGALAVEGGALEGVRRVQGRRDLWSAQVRPTGLGAVTLRLAATGTCGAPGALCTADGRALSAGLVHTVGAAVGLSVADASATEGPGASVDFAVTLSRAAASEVTVRYATKDGTAKARRDYEKASGKLTFAPGETEKTVSVVVLDDAHDEGAETFTLHLRKPKGAVIADGEATGTITNADPLQRDWLARFGRAAAADAVAAVTARLETPRGSGSHLTLAGQRVDLSGTDGGAALEQALSGFARLLGASGGSGSEPDADGWLDRGGAVAAPAARRITGRALLLGSSFRAVLGTGAGVQWTGWGQGASVSQFSSATPSLSLSGETATGSMGMDYERGRLLAGFAMTHSLGEGTAQGSGRSYAMGSAVTTMLPYARYALSERVSAWGLAGTGTGSLTLELDGAAPERYGADLAMTLAAAGVRGDLLRPAEPGGFALALKADAFWVRTVSESVSVRGAGNLAGARADASRLRAVLDGSRTFVLTSGATLTPSATLGLRHDGGDAETGTGVELGAGVGYADPSRGLDMALRLHGLAAHAEDGYGEWGVSGSLRLVPGGSGRGLSASLTPSFGADPGGAERLWTLPDAHALASNDGAPRSSRLDAEVGYGLPAFGGGFTGTPHVGLGLSETARELRMGWRLTSAHAGGFELNLDVARRDIAGDTPEHRIGVGVSARW